MRALIVTADGFEDSELAVPLARLREEGIEADIASTRRGRLRGKHGREIEADLALDEVRPERYDLLVLPGGRAPAALRNERLALELARAFMAADKPVAAICHGPQVLASAGVLQGRRATCYSAAADELRAAGAHYEDREVVVDGNLVTARRPADLPAFIRETLKLVRARGPQAPGASAAPEACR
jgi:protease I